MAAIIDFAFFDEIQRDHGDEQLFRLPADMPELPQDLRGKTMPARRLKRLAEQGVSLLSASVSDREAADNESAMAANRNLTAAQRLYHNTRSHVLRTQAGNRELLAYAKILAVSEATLL